MQVEVGTRGPACSAGPSTPLSLPPLAGGGRVALPDPYYATATATVYQADALAVLRELPSGSVDALITDPPYSSGGQFRSDRTQDVHTKYVQTDSASGHDLSAFSGDNRDQRGYAFWCCLWLGEALRVATPGGVCALFTDWRQLPTTTDALQAGGWVWRGVVPWWKPNGRRVQGRWANSCEYVVWGLPAIVRSKRSGLLLCPASSCATHPGSGTTSPRSHFRSCGSW